MHRLNDHFGEVSASRRIGSAKRDDTVWHV